MITRNMMAGGSGASAVFEFKYTVVTNASGSSDKKAALPINLYGQTGVEISVDWGDGSTSVLKPSDYTASSSLASVHEYASVGTYQITASSSSWSNAYLLSCYADATISSANNANQPVYWWRRTLKSVDSPLPPVKGVMRLASASATSMTASDNDLGFLFHRCEKMTSIPANLFENAGHIEEFNSTFYNCIVLPSIPAGLFDPCVSALNFSDCFRYCLALTSIPVSFFKYCTAAINMYNVFRFCNKIPSVPADLFKYNTHVTNLGGAFSKCDALKNFTLCIGSPNVATVTDFILNASGVTRIVCVPANSTTYTSFNSYKNSSNNVTVSTDNADCGIEEEEDDSEVFKITVNTAAAIEGNRKTGIPFSIYSFYSSGEDEMPILTVDWGDNTTTTIEKSSYSSYADQAPSVHEYVQAGTYTISVTSTNWKNTNIITIRSTTDITYNSNIEHLYYFRKTLISVDAPLPRAGVNWHSSPTQLYQCSGSSHGITQLTYMFCHCTKLQSVHSNIMKRNTCNADLLETGNTTYSRSISYAFYNCQSLQAIPATLVKDCSISSMDYAFYGCSSLTSIPTGLFGQAESTYIGGNNSTLKGLFQNCTFLTSIPVDLFSDLYISNANLSFNSCFKGCTSLTAIPETLLSSMSNASGTSFDLSNLFEGCTSLTSIPTKFFLVPAGISRVDYCFNGCTGISNFKLKFTARNISNFASFISDASNVERILCVPSSSTTYTNATSFANASNGVTVIGDGISCTDATWEFTIDTEATTTGATQGAIPFQLYLSSAKLIVDWGDGSTSVLTSSNYPYASTTAPSIHTYSSPGEYTITIGSDNWNEVLISTYTSSSSVPSYLAIWRQTLTSIDTSLPPFDNANAAMYIFYNCTKLESIPSNLFINNSSKVNNVQSCFYNCSSLQSIPAGLFDCLTKVTSFTSCFQYCTSLASIPSGLFDKNTLVTRFDYCFNGCSSLTSIPSGLFDKNTLVTRFDYCFKNCSALASIPSGLFDKNTAVTTFGYCFEYCSALASIPSGLFDNNTAVTTIYYCFDGCSSLTSIPSGLFDKNTLVTSFSTCFAECTSLTSVPSGLFDKNTAVTIFTSCFSGCSSLTSIPDGLFSKNTAVTNFSYCFDGCTSLLNFHLIISSSSVTSFTNFISNASNVERILCVPDNSTTYTNASSFANNSNNVIVSTDIIDCLETWEITVNTEATVAGEKKTGIPFSLYNQTDENITLYVDWGDNTSSVLTPSNYPRDDSRASTHEYTNPGIYTVTIASSDWENTYIAQNGWVQITTVDVNYENGISPDSTIANCLYWYKRTVIGVTKLPKVKGVNELSGSSSSSPWKKLADSFEDIFNNCSKLTSLPSDLFDNNTSITSFTGAFEYCKSLASLPSGLFDKNTAVTTFSYCFCQCYALTSLPSGLFDKNTAVTSFKNCFERCRALASLPSGLFDKNTAVTEFSSCFHICNSLTSVPSGLFDKNTAVTTFSSCFSGSTALQSVPVGLFAKNTLVTDFSYCFKECIALKNFKLVIGSSSVAYCGDFIASAANVTRIICAPENSSTYRKFSSYSRIGDYNNNIQVSSTEHDCYQALDYNVNTEASISNATSASVSIQAVLNASSKLTIDWGDGNVVELDPDEVIEQNLIHSYSEAGIYNIVVGTTNWLDYEFLTDSNALSSNSLIQTFRNTVTSINSALPLLSNNNINYWFYNCTHLTSYSSHIFDNLINATSSIACFKNCSALSVISAGTLRKQELLQNATSMFEGCTSITNIPSGLLSQCKQLTTIDNIFSGCTNLSSIPNTLLLNNNISSQINAFYGCSNSNPTLLTKTQAETNHLYIELFDTEATNIDGNTVGIPFNLSLEQVQLTVDWGDSNIQTLTSADYQLDDTSSSVHQYTNKGLYFVSINSNDWSHTYLGIHQTTTSNLTSSNNINCLYQRSLTLIEGVTKLNANPASRCLNYTDQATYTYNSLAYFYKECKKLKYVPANLFSGNTAATNFSYCFYQCYALQTVPANLFSGNTAATNFSYCFQYCYNLQTIPAILFSNNTRATNFNYCFYNCNELASIPATLFSNNTRASSFSYCFAYCNGLASIPSGLFDSNTEVTSFAGCFYYCYRSGYLGYGVSSVPAGFFDHNTRVTNFSYCFYYCYNLETIPAGLFDNNTAVTSFSYCFYKCDLRSIPAGLFDNNTAVTSFSNCFYGNTFILSIPDNLFLYNTEVTSFSYCFYDCWVRDFSLHIGSSKVAYVSSFVKKSTRYTRIVYVPQNSTTYTAFSGEAEVLGISVAGE